MKKNRPLINEAITEALSEGRMQPIEVTHKLVNKYGFNRSTVSLNIRRMCENGEVVRFTDDKGVVLVQLVKEDCRGSFVQMMDLLLAPVRGRAV